LLGGCGCGARGKGKVMAGKKAKNEIESIRTELNELTEAIYALREQVMAEAAATAATASRDRQTSAVASPFGMRAAVDGEAGSGEASSAGYVRLAAASGEDEPLAFHWSAESVPVSSIFEQDMDGLARLLAAIGHRQRLSILKALLTRPSSAADLVALLKLGTTGAAYHHLNVLQSVDLVTQEDRGIFSIQPHRVGTLVSILASPFATTTIGAMPDSEEAASGADEEPASKRKGKKKSAA